MPPEQSLEVARQIKEEHAYVCGDMAKEFAKYDDKPEKYLRQYEGTHFRWVQGWLGGHGVGGCRAVLTRLDEEGGSCCCCPST